MLNNFDSKVGERIKQARKSIGLSQRKAAKLLYVDTNKLSRIETGKQPAEFEDIFKFSQLYKKDIYYFLADFKAPQNK